MTEKSQTMSLIEHLKELRIRLIRSCCVVLIFVIGAYCFRKEILDLIRQPIEVPLQKYSSHVETSKTSILNCQCQEVIPKTLPKKLTCLCPKTSKKFSQSSSMIFTGVSEVFFTQMKVAFFSGIFLAFPYLLIELWGFLMPALYSSERKFFWWFAISSYLSFIGGALFSYFMVFPFGFDFFLSLTQLNEIMPFLSISEYLSFALKLLIAFGTVFEMPLAVFILSRMGIVTPILMLKHFKHAILIIAIFSAILTPPDPFTMLLMTFPLCLLYLISIVISYLGVDYRKAALRKQGWEHYDNL